MSILSSLKPVLEQPKYVRINKRRISYFAAQFDKNKIAHWLKISPFNMALLNEREIVAFLFVLNSISFSYWGDPKWTVTYKDKVYDGAQGMAACLGNAIEYGVPLLDSHYLANMQREDLAQILQGNVEIPLFNERLRILNEIGAIIRKEFQGDFSSVLERAKRNASSLVTILAEHFQSFEDIAEYREHRVYFRKRAQLLSSDLSHYFRLKDTDKLTACADYKLPQTLRRHGILQYSDDLQQQIRRKEEISAGSEEEIEIRAHTIYAVELIKKKITGITSTQINDFLWLEGQIKLPTDEPYHLTRTTAY